MAQNPFPHSTDNKRYHTWNYHLRQKFGGKVFKVPLNAGFTCPNLDGSKGTGGCIFCANGGGGAAPGAAAGELSRQFEAGRDALHRKWPQAQYIAYFQSNTNTYAPLERLRELFEAALRPPGVVGLAVATRADVLNEETACYLAQLSRRTYLTVELGLQTAHDETGGRINRCHTYAEFLEGYRLLADRGIPVCVHLINGLPGESGPMMLETARRVAALRPHSVKIHMLHLLRGTPAAAMWSRGAFSLLGRAEYVDIVCRQLELLPPETVIQRLTGDAPLGELLAPQWTRKKFVVLNEIDKELARRDTMQGAAFPQK